MQIIIDIPDDLRKHLDWLSSNYLKEIIKKGITLPQNHSRLIEADEVIAEIYDRYMSSDMKIYNETAKKCIQIISNANTVISGNNYTESQLQKKYEEKLMPIGNENLRRRREKVLPVSEETKERFQEALRQIRKENEQVE